MIIIRAPCRWIGAAAITIFPVVLVDGLITDDELALGGLLDHESEHYAQQRRWAIYGLGVGLLAWWALYLLALPALWNPWRRRWETAAYLAEGLSNAGINEVLRHAPYFLRW